MSDSAENIGTLGLKPLPYHEAMCVYLKEEVPDVWHWYASNKVRDEQAEAIRFELLKSTYRVEREAQPEIYAAAEDVARKVCRHYQQSSCATSVGTSRSSWPRTGTRIVPPYWIVWSGF